MDGLTNDQVTQIDVAQAVREAAMLADITISMWSGERSDSGLMEEVKRNKGAVGNVGRVIKNMLAGVDGKLKDVRSSFLAVRASHYSMTLPWVGDPHAERQRGPRLLPHLLFDRYLGAVGKRKREAGLMLDAFLAEYPGLVAQAKSNLAAMADAVYPTVDEVKSAFRIHFDFEPIPAGASFKGLPDHALERLSMGLHRKQEAMIGRATSAAWGEVRERVGHLVERLGDPDAKFKESTIANVRELIAVLPAWNLMGSEQMAEVKDDIERMLAGVDAKALRKDAQARADVAGQAKAVTDKLSSWGV